MRLSEYRPSALVCVVKLVPTTPTRAPTRGWPDAWSVTRPATVPCCADAAAGSASATSNPIPAKNGRTLVTFMAATSSSENAYVPHHGTRGTRCEARDAPPEPNRPGPGNLPRSAQQATSRATWERVRAEYGREIEQR